MKHVNVVRNIAQASSLLDAMASDKRLEILCLVVRGEITVTDLALAVALSQPAVSQHLAKLRAARLVQTRRDAQKIFYRCDSVAVDQMLNVIEELCEAGLAVD